MFTFLRRLITKRRPVVLLSIDGAGIRGIIPAILLRELETRVHALGRQEPLCELFDLISGTSSGGILALGLSAPAPGITASRSESPGRTTDELVALYQDRSDDIFPTSTFHALRSVRQAFGDKYDADNIEQLFEELFGELTIENALSKLLITSYDTERRKPFFFKNWSRDGDRHRLNFYMRDVARATSAAPTFFDPAYITSVPPNGEHFCLIDGAIIANNPALCALIEARKLYPHGDDFVVVSLGTGTTVMQHSYDDMRRWGYIDWVSPIRGVPLASMTFDGQAELVRYQLDKLPGVRYYRFNAPLVGCSEEIDDARPENLEALRRLAHAIIHDTSDDLDAVAKLLASR